jgi:DNA primase
VNGGKQLMINELNYLYENVNGLISKGNNCFVGRCPLCGDSKKSQNKKRFNIKDTGKGFIYHCWNCGQSGNIIKLYSILENVSLNDAYNVFHDYSNIKSLFKRDFTTNQVSKTETANNFNYILEDCISINSTPKGEIEKQYLNILRDFRKHRKIKIITDIAIKGKYKNRIIIPVYDETTNLIYFQARRIYGHMLPKFLNPTSPKELLIPNYHLIKNVDSVIVTEGLMDCYSINGPATCCLGKEINDNFIYKLYDKCREIIIALDNDNDGIEATKKIYYNSAYNKKLKYFFNPFSNIKDINDLLCSNKIENIYNFIIEQSLNYMETKIHISRW